MKVEQFRYLSPEANALRRRDGTPPWSVHPCEVDDVAAPLGSYSPMFEQHIREASALREEIEAGA